MPLFDAHMILAVVGTAIIGGFIGLDRTAVGQFMISQPIVAGPLVGWILGDPTAGLIIGATLELIWILDMPVGTFVPADSTISAVSSTAIASLGHPGGAPLWVIGMSILLTTAMTLVTMRADGMIRHWNSRLVEGMEVVQKQQLGQRLARAHLSGLAIFFLKSFVLCLIFVPAGIMVVKVFQHMPAYVHRALSLFVRLLPLLGVSLMVRKLSIKLIDLFLLSGFVIAAVMGQIFHAPASVVVLLIVAVGWLGAGYREQRS